MMFSRTPSRIKALLFVGMYFLSLPVAALAVQADEKSLVEGAKLCTQYLPRVERQHGIPEHLLAAIASTESGRFHRGLGLNLPWPWTINVNGRGYFFDTKQEAVAAVNKLRSQGYQSIDVGCMQVNLHHHPKAFASVEQAFDPAYNIGYAADFLKTNFTQEGSWRKATGDYHSRTALYGNSYATQVYNAWGRIVTKVADARAGKPVLNTAATPAPHTGERSFASASRIVRPSYHSLHMRMIKVASLDKRPTRHRENGVVVIRPQKDEGIMQFSEQGSANDGLLIKAASVTSTSHSALSNPADSPARTAENKGIKVINLASGKTSNTLPTTNNAKGQFTPRPRTTTPTTNTASSQGESSHRLFVFDN